MTSRSCSFSTASPRRQSKSLLQSSKNSGRNKVGSRRHFRPRRRRCRKCRTCSKHLTTPQKRKSCHPRGYRTNESGVRRTRGFRMRTTHTRKFERASSEAFRFTQICWRLPSRSKTRHKTSYDVVIENAQKWRGKRRRDSVSKVATSPLGRMRAESSTACAT